MHHCYISGHNSYGIVLGSGSDDSKVIGCTIISNTHDGIYVGAVDCLIQLNRVDSNGTAGGDLYSGIKLVSADRCLIQNNHCRGNDKYGIDISNSGCNDDIVTGNHCSLNSVSQINDSGTNTLPNGAVGTTNLALDDLNYV